MHNVERFAFAAFGLAVMVSVWGGAFAAAIKAVGGLDRFAAALRIVGI